MYNQISRETKQKVLNMSNAGMPRAMIQERLKVTITTIRRIVNNDVSKIYIKKFGKLKITEKVNHIEISLIDNKLIRTIDSPLETVME